MVIVAMQYIVYDLIGIAHRDKPSKNNDHTLQCYPTSQFYGA